MTAVGVSPGSRFRLADEAIVAALCVAESAVLWLGWSAAMGTDRAVASRFPFWIALTTMLAGTMLPRLLDGFDVWDPLYRVLMVLGVVANASVAVAAISFPARHGLTDGWPHDALRSLILRPVGVHPTAWGALALVAYAWWRGRSRARPELDGAYRMLRVGSVALLGVVTFDLAASPALWRGAERQAVLLFFAASLLAIGASRALQSENAPRRDGYRAAAAVAGPALAVVLVGLLAGSLLSRDLVETALWALGPILWVIGLAVRIVIFTLAFAALIVVSPLLWLLAGRHFNFAGFHLTPPTVGQGDVVKRSAHHAAHAPDAIRYLAAAAIIAASVAALTRFVLRGRRRRGRVGGTEERSRVGPSLDLLSWLRALLALAGRRRPPVGPDALGSLRGDPVYAHTVRVRETYRSFLRSSAEAGHGRRAGWTPREFAATSSADVDEAGVLVALHALTDAYDRARYRPEPTDAADADLAAASWARMNDPRRTRA